jgi:hypothetical protein
VIQVFSNLICGQLANDASYYQIACCSASDLVRYVAWYMELVIGPAKLKLRVISFNCFVMLMLVLTRFVCK